MPLVVCEIWSDLFNKGDSWAKFLRGILQALKQSLFDIRVVIIHLLNLWSLNYVALQPDEKVISLSLPPSHVSIMQIVINLLWC